MPGDFLNGVDNSILTPEYNGQGNQGTTDSVQETGNIGEQVQGAPQVDGQAQDTGANVAQEGYQIGEEHFDNVEALIEAYQNMQAASDQLQKNYKNLQSDYTKKAQRLSMMNKIGTQNLGNAGQVRPMVQPMPQQQQLTPDFNSYMFGREFQRAQQPPINYAQPTVDASVIQMAADQKIAELRLQDQEFDEVSPILWDVIETDPYFANVKFTDIDMTKNAIDLAYQMAKSKVNQAKANININNARKEAYQAKQQKVLNNDASNVANGSGKRTPAKSDVDKIRESILGAKPQRF